MPPLLAVQECLGKHASTLKYFDAEVEAALIEAERAGDFQELREAIAGGLWSAICAEHAPDCHDLDAGQRGTLLLARMQEWLSARRPPTYKEFLRAEYERTQRARSEEPPRELPMPDDERPAPYRWEFAAEAPPGFPQGGDEDDDPLSDTAVPATP